jgi:Saf4/Yju2 protein
MFNLFLSIYYSEANIPAPVPSCGEYIYKGRKFNARKETTDEKYLSISIYRFYIRCTRCSAQISFKTDPKQMDYQVESGAKRNFEPWRDNKLVDETEEQRLDRLEREEQEEEAAQRDVMAALEAKTMDAKTEMAVADALDEIRVRNARLDRTQQAASEDLNSGNVASSTRTAQEIEDDEAARLAFENAEGERVIRIAPEQEVEVESGIALPSFQRSKKKNKKAAGKSLLGIKK